MSNDILRLPEGDKIQLRVTRFTMLVIGLVVITLALALPSNIFWITYFAGPLFASSWGAVAFMSIWSRRITEGGAFWGMAAGFAVNVAMNVLSIMGGIDWPVIMDPILVGGLASLITVVTVSRVGTVTVAEHTYREGLHRIPDGEKNPSEIRQTLIWPKVMVVVGLATVTVLYLFYARPYAEARISADTMEVSQHGG